MQLTKRIPWGELVRFGLSGALNTVLAYCVFALLILVGAHYVLALLADYTFAILYSLVVNKMFTFRHTGAFKVSMAVSMALTYGVLFLFNWGLAYVLIDLWRWQPLPSQAAATVLVAGASFLLQRYVVFRPSAKPGAP